MNNDTQIVFTARDDTRAAIESVARGLTSIKTAADGLEGAISNLGGLKALMGVTFAGFSINTFVDGVHSAIHSLAELDDAAERTGASVEKLTALKGVAKIGDFDFSQVEEGLVRLAKAMAGADDEARAAGHALAALKLDPDQLRGKDTADQLKAIADALNQYRDGAGKTALIQDLLGKSGAKLLPYLKDLAETGELVGKSTSEQAALADQYEKNLKKLNAGLDAWKKTMANDLLPTLVAMTDEMVKARKESGLLGEIFAGGGVIGLKIAGIDPDPLKRAEKEATAAFDRLAKARKALADLDQSNAPEYGGLLGKGLREADRLRLQSYIKDQEEALKKATARQKRLARAGHGETEVDLPTLAYQSRDPKTDGSNGKKAEDLDDIWREMYVKNAKDAVKELEAMAKAQEEYGKSVEALLNPLEQQAATLEKEAATFGLSEDAIQNNVIARLEEAKAIAEANGAWPQHLAFLEREIEARKRIAQASENLQLERLLGATPTGQMEKSRQDMLLLAKALNDGRLNESEYLEAVQTQLKTLPEDLNKAKSAAEELGMTFASAFEDALVGGKSLKDVLSGLEKDFVRILTRKTVTEPLAEWASGLFKPSGSSASGGGLASAAGSWLAQAFGFANGGIMTSSGPVPLRAYATGGIATGPQMALFGEGSLNEAYVPLPDGHSIPVKLNGRSGNTIVNHFNISTPDVNSFRQSQGQILADINRALAAGRRNM